MTVVPAASVVVPVRDGEATLGACLDAILASAARTIEVIVVDDGSTDRSAELAQERPVTLVRLPGPVGAAGARNAGAQLARGEVLVFIDADVIVAPDTVERMLGVLRSEPGACAVFCSFGRRTPAGGFVTVYKNLLHHYTHQRSRREAATFCSGFGAIRRDVFLAAGGFDPRLRYLEDVDLGYRLHRAGHRIVLERSIQVTHAKAYTLWRLVHSDVVGRAIPWTRLMLRHRIFRADLNTTSSQVASVTLAWLALGAAAAVVVSPAFLLVSTGLAGGLAALNRHFLAFARREMGLAFALRSFPLLALGYLYSGLGLVAGVVSYALRLA